MGILIAVKVIPQGHANKIDSFSQNPDGAFEMKLRVTAAPEDGKANEAVIKLVAKHFKIAKSQVKIISGWTSRHKKIELIDVQPDFLSSNLQLSLL